MKKYIAIITILFAVFSCQKDQKSFEISGNIDGIENGKKVYLKALMNGKAINVDTSEVNEGKFSFVGAVETPDVHLLTVESVRASLPFILGNENLDFTIYKDSITLSKIEGSLDNDVAQKYTKGVIVFQKKNQALREQARTAQKNKDTVFLKSFGDKMIELRNENNEYNLNFIENHKNSLFTVLLLENLQSQRVIDPKQAKDLFSEFPVDLQESASGKRIKEKIDIALTTAIGSVAPDFTAPDTEGKDLTLSEIKGKVTIIDFWAAWCGPCRRENPNIVKIYEKYHDKGLEIIGVSLDGNPRQKDAKQEWIDAIAKDGLTWHQVSNLNYFNGQVAKQYNIRSIPAMFVLDEEGTIIAKNLRGPALEQKISELLD